MADRLDRLNQDLSRENLRLKSHFKSQEDDRKYLVKQLVAVKVSQRSPQFDMELCLVVATAVLEACGRRKNAYNLVALLRRTA